MGSLTFGRWHDRATGLAGALAARGLAPGERVGLVFEEAAWNEFAVAFVAVLRAGGVAVPLSARLAPPELAAMLADCDAVGVVHAPGEPPAVARGWTAGSDESSAGHAPAGPRPDDPAQILYTSGTTGRPKGVVATHANLAHGLGGRRRPFAHSRFLAHAFPIGTNAGQTMLLNALDAAPAVVTLPRFTPSRFARLIEDHAAGTVFVVPAMAIEMLASPSVAERDLSSVLLLGSAASALPAAVAARLTRLFPEASIVNYYTSTEAAPAQTVMMFDAARPGSVGRALVGGAVRICGPGGAPLPAGEAGEVWLRSPAATRSYHGDPAATGRTFRDGWVRMGDLGRLDADGYLYLLDREGDVVKTGAYKVSTLHVEEAVYQHPGVLEAAVVGLPHDVLGTQLAAAVVARTELDPRDLRLFLSERLAPHEIPARIVAVDALPRNRSGKVDKRDLTRRLT